jgi:5-(carboxyamino)imidazole ribonucleotide synthase
VGPLAILGGGQLGRMTLQAASVLGIDVVIGERFAGSPAARMTDRSVVFPNGWDDPEALDQLAEMAPIVTLESEFVDAAVLRALEQRGAKVWPSPDCVATVQDKLLQKEALAGAELPVPRFVAVGSVKDVVRAGAELGWPLMLKARRDGYDGRGNAIVIDAVAAEAACAKLGFPDRQLFVEAFVKFERELAVIVVRTWAGEVVVYPVVETRQDPILHVCRAVLAPADLTPTVAEQASAIARGAVEAVGGVGTFGVEMFLLPDARVLVNELAPRPHNSGHYTIEACSTSQFSNHVRAVLDLPLGAPDMRVPAAVMVNLLGTGAGEVRGADLFAALAGPETFVHVYGKAENRPGRKLGHVTALGSSLQEAMQRAESAAECLRL